MGWFSNLWRRTTAAAGGAVKAVKEFAVGVRAGLAGAVPGGWASDHAAEANHFTGWQYIAIHAGAMQAADAEVEAYNDDQQSDRRQTRRKSLRAQYGSMRAYKALYGAEDRETDPLPQDHSLVKLQKRPNPWMSGSEFRYRFFQQIKTTGSCYIWNVPSKQVGANGLPITVQRFILPTALLTPVWPTKDMPMGAYRVGAAISRWFPARDVDGFQDFPGWYRLAGKVIDAREVQVIRLPHPIFLDDGQSPLAAGAQWIDVGTQIDTSRNAQFVNGPNPSIVVMAGPDQELSPEQAEATAAKINAKYAGAPNAGKAMVVNSGTDVKWPNGNTAKEMDYVGSAEQNREQQLALHHAPPVAVGIQDPGAYAAYYAAQKGWRSGGVQPYLNMLAESDTITLGPQYGSGITIEVNAPAVDDAELIEKQLATDIQAKAITRNEFRAKRGMPPLKGPEGDELVGGGPQSGMGGGGLPGMPGQSGQQNGGGGILDRLLEPVNRLNGANGNGSSNGNGNGKHHASVGSALKSAARSRTYAVAAAVLTRAKGFDESKHPRGDDGRFISAGKIEAARTDKEAAVELLKQTTKPEERQKLVEALGPMGKEAAREVESGSGVTAPESQKPPKNKIKITGDLIKSEAADTSDRLSVMEAMTPDEREKMESNIGYAKEENRDEWVREKLNEIDFEDEAAESLRASGDDPEDEVLIETESESLRNEKRAELEDTFDAEDEYDYEGDYIREFLRKHEDEPRFQGGFTEFNTWGKDHDGNTVLGFETSAGSTYEVWASEESPMAKKALGVDATEIGFNDAGGNFGITGAGSAREVFRNVTDATVELIRHQGIPVVYFSAAEPSRQKLYDRLVKSLAHDLPEYAAIAANKPKGGRAYVVALKDEIVDIMQRAQAQGIEPEQLAGKSRKARKSDAPLKWELMKPEKNPAWFDDDAEWSEYDQQPAKEPVA